MKLKAKEQGKLMETKASSLKRLTKWVNPHNKTARKGTNYSCQD